MKTLVTAKLSGRCGGAPRHFAKLHMKHCNAVGALLNSNTNFDITGKIPHSTSKCECGNDAFDGVQISAWVRTRMWSVRCVWGTCAPAIKRVCRAIRVTPKRVWGTV